MDWGATCQQFPQCWVVFEATQSHPDEDRLMVDALEVQGCFSDFWEAWHFYESLHQAEPQRDFMIYHTSNAELIVHMAIPRKK